MVERGVDHRIRLGGATGETARIFQRAAMYLGSRLLKPARADVRAGEAEHLMPVREKLVDDPGADEAVGSGNENTHVGSLPTCRKNRCVTPAYAEAGV